MNQKLRKLIQKTPMEKNREMAVLGKRVDWIVSTRIEWNQRKQNSDSLHIDNKPIGRERAGQTGRAEDS